MEKKAKVKLIAAISLFVAAVIVIVVCLINWKQGKTDPGIEDPILPGESVSEDNTAGYTESGVGYPEGSIDKVLAESKADSGAAAKNYTGKTMTFTAKVKATDNAVGYIDLTPSSGDFAGETIACNVADGTDAKLMQLVNGRSVGDSVTVSGHFETDENGQLRFYIESMKLS